MNNQQLLASYENKGNNDEIDLIGLLAVIWQRRWLVIGTIIAFLAVAILYLNVATLPGRRYSLPERRHLQTYGRIDRNAVTGV